MRRHQAIHLLCGLLLSAGVLLAQTSDLFFSEYIEGSSYNKAVEIYNGTGASVDLSLYSLELYSNGNSSPNSTMTLSGTLADGDVYVVAHAQADAAILNVADATNSAVINFNGDDAFAMRKNGVGLIDVIGQIGVDPGSSWSNNGVSTKDQTLRRKASVCSGDDDGSDAFDPSVEWLNYAKDTFDGLGSHSSNCAAATIDVIINEIHADPDAAEGDANGDGSVDSSQDEFVEIVNNSSAAVDITGWTLSDGASIRHTFPSGSVLQPGHAVVVFGGGAPAGDFGGALVQTAGSGALGLNNSGDTVTLNDGSTDQDAVTYGGEGGDNQSLTRDPDISGAAFVKHTTATNADGARYSPGCRIDGSSFFSTYIHDVQGDGGSSPMNGATNVVIEGIVVGDFQDAAELGGFFVQEEDNQHDGDDMTSEGIFVYADASVADVNVGEKVRVTGDVTEYYEKTELTNVSQIAVVGTPGAPTPATVTLPVSALTDWEAKEGMLIAVNQELTVTGNKGLVHYGELELSVNGRLYTPTNIVDPGVDANNKQDENDRSRIQLDDGSHASNPDPIPYIDADNTRRIGSTLPSLTGVLDYSYSAYEIHPTTSVSFTDANPRSASPAATGGPLTVASFNVLNFFNGDGQGGGFPTSRGADTYDEYQRQRTKIISAISAIDADIVGLIEIENDGFGPNSAIQDLVNGLNDAMGAGTYAFIDPGVAQVGTDEITCALIYKPASVTPQGAAAILDSSVDPRFADINRPSIAQTFKDGGNEIFTVDVNHFKSKGSACSGDPDTGDGQGNCNQTRVDAANALTDWLATDPTGSNDPDFLIIGDLNSYAKEDPIVAIKDAGYVDLPERFIGVAYSYVYSSQSGVLDHALASSSLNASVTGATIWHINADEPPELDYNDSNPPALYDPGPYRSSDHDPVVVGLNLENPVSVDMSTFQAVYNGDGVTLSWSTASEINVAGFNILRLEGSSEYEQINDDLLPARSGLRGGDYEFHDADGGLSSQYKLEEIYIDGHAEYYGPIGVQTASDVKEMSAPREFALRPNYPNPFNPSTTIRFDAPRQAQVSIRIYDVSGRLITTLVDGGVAPGSHSVAWNGKDIHGKSVPAGLYFCRMRGEDFSQVRKLTLVK